MKTVIEMAREAGFATSWTEAAGEALERFAELVRADERARMAEQQEPVAYMGTDIEGSPNKFRLNPFGGCVPLYKKPQSVKVWDAEGYGALCQELEGWKAKAQRKPLTVDEVWQNDQLMSLNAELGCSMDLLMEVARAIEAAHGIGEKLDAA